jgi:hypothetical protein
VVDRCSIQITNAGKIAEKVMAMSRWFDDDFSIAI